MWPTAAAADLAGSGGSLTVLSDAMLRSVPQTTDDNRDSGSGDVNGDGLVDTADLALAEQITLGQVIPTQDHVARGDVSPVGSPDGVIDVQDVARIRRMILGIEDF